MVTRRRFLQAVGISGGAGALFATMGALGLAPAGQAVPGTRRPVSRSGAGVASVLFCG
jgi:monoamine oxidase